MLDNNKINKQIKINNIKYKLIKNKIVKKI